MGQFIRYLFLESYSIRKIIFSFSGIGLIIGISERLLKRKHRLWPLILVLSLKILLFIPLDYFLLMHPGIDPTTDKAVQIYCFWRDVLMSAFFIWTYGGNNGKTGLTLFLGEMSATIFTIPVLMLVNLMEGRAMITEVNDVFLPVDLLMPVLTWMVWLLLRRMVDAYSWRFRAWKPKHERLLWAGFMLYVFSASIYSTASDMVAGTIHGLVMIHQLWGIVFMGALITWTVLRQKKENRFHEQLEYQMGTQGTYEALMKRRQKMTAANREDILRRIDAFEKAIVERRSMEEKDALAFLEQLRRDADLLDTDGNGWSGDVVIDAVLRLKKQELEELGATVDFRCVSFQRNQSGGAEKPQRGDMEFLIPGMLGLLCDEWMDQYRKAGPGGFANTCVLQIHRIKGQLVIEMNVKRGWDKKRLRDLKRLAARAGGVMKSGAETGNVPFGMRLFTDRRTWQAEGRYGEESTNGCMILVPWGDK